MTNKIIIINEKDVLERLNQFFGDGLFEYLFFESPIEGLKTLRDSSDIALIIANIAMQGIDVISFLKEVNKHSPKTMKIMLVNSKKLATSISAIKQTNVFSVIGVPCSDYELKTSVSNAIKFYKLSIDFQKHKILEKKRYSKVEQLNKRLRIKLQKDAKAVSGLLQRQEKSFIQLLMVLSKILESSRPMIAAHAKRVSIISKELARQFNYKDLKPNQIDIASLFHDIGKLTIPEYLVDKDIDTLNEYEISMLNKTPIAGYQLLQSIEKVKKIADIIRGRRENYDGSGFPDNLSGNDIPFGSRIIRVANDYDRLTCREDLSRQDAIKYLRDKSGIEYDPNVVSKFINILEKFEIPTEKEIVILQDMLREGHVLSRDIMIITGGAVLKKDTIIEPSHIIKLRELDIDTPVISRIFIYKFSLKKRNFNLPNNAVQV